MISPLAVAPDIRLRPGSTQPVGPTLWPRLLSGRLFRQNAAEFLLSNAQIYGDLVYFTAAGRSFLQFNHPELVQEMLVRDAGHHHRNLVMQRSKAVLGEGLLTSEEPLHMRQRRLAQPAFHRERIAAYGQVIGSYTERMAEGWEHGTTFDVREQMLLLALRIVGKTLFDTDVDQDVHTFAAAVDSFQGFLPLAFVPFSGLVQRLPLPAMRRIRSGREELDALIYGMIRERRADPGDRGDLLSMLLAAKDPDIGNPDIGNPDIGNPDSGSPDSGSRDSEDTQAGMSDSLVRDECLTILLAGHETTANALSFALWLLARHPEVQVQLAEEATRVLGGRAPGAEDYPKLPLAEQVFAEALRLYPPVWVTARTAAEDYEYRGFLIRKGTALLAPQFAVQRDPRFWADPLAFDPSRFTAEAKATRPRMAYFPFGAGGRQCIGEGLAWMEGALCLAAMMQRWSVALPPGAAAELSLNPAISLRPAGPVVLRVERR